MKVIKFAPGLIPVLKHEEHDQKTHGSWAGVSGLATLGKELLTPAQMKAFDNEIKKVPESHIEALIASGTKVRIMDSPKLMSPDEAPHFNRGDNEIRLDKNSGASALLHEIGHALDFNAKSGNGFLSDDPNFRKIIKDSKFPDFSTQRNTFARNEEFAVAYENYFTDGGKFIGASPTKEFKQVMEGIGTYILSEKVQKHQEHDQSSHGNWAKGIASELTGWSPKDKVPDGPRNATGTTEKFWDNWEHGVDGDQFVDLYRQYAGEMLGLPVPKSDKDVGGPENYLTQRGFGASSTSAVRNQTEAVLSAIANGRPQPTLYRGIAASNEESRALLEQFTSLEEGDTIDMPLVSTTRSLGVAEWYAVDRSKTPNDSKVILKIQEGAKGVSVNPKNSWYPSDFETITSGKFEVVGKSEVTVPYWSRSAVIGTTFKDRDDQTIYRVSDPNDPSWGSKSDAESAVRFKILKDGINSGDFSKIETSTIKYTNDRNPSGVEEDASRITVNTWKRQEPKTFTVIEVKMVEPHVVKKGADLGITFHNLFNDVPFIRDEEEVLKHQEHDQSTHGSWAEGGNGLGIEEVMRLHKPSDPQQNKVYAAERSIYPPLANPLEKPAYPKRDDFASREDYDKAYKDYSKKWTAWAVEEQAHILSDMGKELLDGTPAGVKKYVEQVIKEDWFVEKFGDGSSLPKLDVKTTNTNAAGRHILKMQKDRATGRIIKTVHEISIDRQSVKNERTLLHEISHYATAITQTESFSAHGAEFANNHIFVVGQAVGSAGAQALASAYKSEGVEIGD